MSTKLTNEFYQYIQTVTPASKPAERETGLLRPWQTANINLLYSILLVVMLKTMFHRAGLSMWHKEIDANLLVDLISNVVLMELTRGVCAVTQTLLITQRPMNADASIGHKKILVQILLLFALGTTQEVHQHCITGLAAIIAMIKHP